MNNEQKSAHEPRQGGNLLVLALLSFIVGGLSGAVGAAFRLSLETADRVRDATLAWAQGEHAGGLALIVLACGACAGLAAGLARRLSPQAEGSGIPHVEAVLNGELPPAPFTLIPVKFLGGLLAIGAGLALGREGPTVQMGATLGHLLGQVFRLDRDDCRALLAAGAGAGLATAFNAPIAGAVFVLEELARRFDPRITIATIGASAGAIAVARIIFGEAPDFHVEPLHYTGISTVPVHLALGLVAGLLGMAYNRTILGALKLGERYCRGPVEIPAVLVGAAVGILAWFSPSWVGGGDAITQQTLGGGEALGMVTAIFVVRFILGPVSYAARTPGGLFAPMLVLGAQMGLVFGSLCRMCLPDVAADPTADAVVGMAAFFTAVVRAPVTGIILVIELTGSFTLFLPMLSACFVAMLVPTILGNPPIYDSLGMRTRR